MEADTLVTGAKEQRPYTTRTDATVNRNTSTSNSEDITSEQDTTLVKSDPPGSTHTSFNYVNIVVSGYHFKTLHETLLRFPDTLLGNSVKRQKFWDEKRNALVFHRCRQSFESILYFYQSGGSIIQPINVEQDVFLEEAKFFKLPLLDFFMPEDINMPSAGDSDKSVQKSKFEELIYAIVQENDTKRWRALALFDVSMTFIFVALQCIRTENSMKGANIQLRLVSVEAVCIAWFLIIFSLRLFIEKKKKVFLLQFMSLVDVAVILCFMIDLTIYIKLAEVPETGIIIAVVGCVRIVGFMRLFNIARYSELLFCLGVALKRSLADLAQVLILIFLVTFVFATLAYYIEEDRMNAGPQSYTTFASVFDAIYWGTITIATVGYGDIAPKTPGGKSVGAALALLGLPLIAIPMPLIMSKFDGYYKDVKRRKENDEVRDKILEDMLQRVDSEDDEPDPLTHLWDKVNGNNKGYKQQAAAETDRHDMSWNELVGEGYRCAIIDNKRGSHVLSGISHGDRSRAGSNICLSFSDLSRIFPSIDNVNGSKSRGLHSRTSLSSLADQHCSIKNCYEKVPDRETRGLAASVKGIDEINRERNQDTKLLVRRASMCG